MSQEFDDVTHAFAELLSKLQSANDDDKHAAITFAIDSLLMAVGSICPRLVQFLHDTKCARCRSG
jgi:hypothetical protein